MKLSAAIEKMLVERKYNRFDEFMCLVLRDNYLSEHIDAVQDMVHAINPEYPYGYPLYSTLYESALLDIQDMELAEAFKVTTELYVWWVFDLKRKGL